METRGNKTKASTAEHKIDVREEIDVPEESNAPRLTLPRVPDRIRLGEKDAYEPKIISLGPYHPAKRELKDMQEHKRRYQKDIQNRCGVSSTHDLQEKIKVVEKAVRRCYSEAIHSEKKKAISLEKMTLDGCFIVQYLLLIHEKKKDELDDIIWVHDLLEYDLFLLENQLPFFLLEHIFNCVKEHDQELSSGLTFMDLCKTYFKTMLKKEFVSDQPLEPDHLLHLYHSTLNSPLKNTFNVNSTNAEGIKTRRGRIEDTKDARTGAPIMIPSATVLHEYGITFIQNKKASSILDVEFDKATGVLKIPHLVVEDFTKSQFRNLIAFEQLYCKSKDRGEFMYNFTTYAMFMDYLVNTPEDVALLCKKGILEHSLGSDEDVADLFNNLTDGVFIDPCHYLSQVFEDVKKYQKKLRPKWRAILMRNYLNTPWAIISVLAAAILLILTILQTVFTGISTF